MTSASTGASGGRPLIQSTRGVVTSGHYLASQIGADILRRGGNAADAAAATGFALHVLKPHQNGFGGEVPVLVYAATERRAQSLSGHGVAPRLATIDAFRALGMAVIPGEGLLPAIVPCVLSTWLALLARFGTMRLRDVLEPSLDLCERGLPMYDSLHASIASMAARFRGDWPSSGAVFLVDGAAPRIGTIFRQPALGVTFRRLLEAEASKTDRLAGLRASHEAFYRGAASETIDAFCRAGGGLLRREDLVSFEARFEDPAATSYRGITVHKCRTWTQGPVLLQVLDILERFDLARLGHNSVGYLHTVVEAIKLAMADREAYYGDPDFVPDPLPRLLSKDYAAERARLIAPDRASLELRPGGLPSARVQSIADVEAWSRPARGDTTKLEVIDASGSMVSATPSGGWLMSSPVIPDLGFPLGTRAQVFSLDPHHPNALAPGKRPRTTLTPSLALRDGGPYLSFGSPGGDAQDQWALQFLLNVVDFGMSLQQAVEAPTVCSNHAPSSFFPRGAEPGVVEVEERIAVGTREALATLGHRVRTVGPWALGNTLAASIDTRTGVLAAAASPRLDPAYAIGI